LIVDDERTLNLTERHIRRCDKIITDNGIGISADILEKIFEPLFGTKSFSVGLGLKIVKDIMEAHGGGIAIQNN